MKIVCISDTHSLHNKMLYQIPECDILCVAGDISNVGELIDIESFHTWLVKQPCKHKVVVAGNHDWCFALKRKLAEEILIGDAKGIHYLEGGSVELLGLKIWGGPWQPEFCNWAFNLPRGEQLFAKWEKIPKDTDIVITHGPPYGILDPDLEGRSAGDEALLKCIKVVAPKLHVFGHLHSGYGVKNFGGTQFVNAAICNESYQPINRPLVVNI